MPRFASVSKRASSTMNSAAGAMPLAPDIKKTGLGSSAAMVTAVVTSILQLLNAVDLSVNKVAAPGEGRHAVKGEQEGSHTFTPIVANTSQRQGCNKEPAAESYLELHDTQDLCMDKDNEQLDLIHKIAQAAHCAAQGKVGSGFDVSAAVFGSQRYIRFSPSALASLSARVSSQSTSPYTQEQQEKMAALVRENKERKELLKQTKLKAIAEEQAAKMKELEEEMEKKKKAAEEEAAAEAEEERTRKEEKAESSGTANEDAAMEKKISEGIANLSLGEDEEAEFYVPQDERDALAQELATMEDPLERQEREEEKKLEWKLRMKREKKRRDEVNRLTVEVAKVKDCRQEVQAQADASAKMDKVLGYLEVLSIAWMEERQANRAQEVALKAMRSGFRDIAHEMVTHVGGEVKRLRDNVGKYCEGAIEGAKAIAAVEGEARPRKEPVKLKFPDAYGGKKEENFDNWEASVNSYVYLQHILTEEQVLVAFHALKDEAASFARSLARAAGCENDLVAYSKITPLPQFFKLLRERFADPTRGVRASDKLQTIHSRQWRSARALKGVMDDLVAVLDHVVTENQLVQLFYRAMPEPLRGHFFDKSQQAGITYDVLSREVVLFESKSMPVSTFRHKDLDKGKKWKGRTISGQVRAKDHMVPYSQIEWGLEEEDNSVGQGRSYAAVAAGGRPQSRGAGQAQRGQAMGGRGPGAQGVGGQGNRQVGGRGQGPPPCRSPQRRGGRPPQGGWHPGLPQGRPWEDFGLDQRVWQERVDLDNTSAHCCLSASAFARLVKKEQLEDQVFVVYVRPATEAKEEVSSTDPTIAKLLEEFKDLTESPTGVVSRPIQHRIEIEPGSRTPKGAVYRMSPRELEELRKQLDELLEKGWIRPSSSPFGALVLFVPKKEGELRMCIDYRGLNAISVKNAEPLPRIDDLLDRVQGCKYFSKIDLKSGYHQIEVHPDDQYKTAFWTRYGHYEFIVMRFGLTNAPATFQRCMNDLFRPWLDKFVEVYLDDILVFSKTLQEHQGHLRQVLEKLREASFKINPKKCEWAKTQVLYLGHVLDGDGIKPEDSKIATIRDWSSPRTLTDLRSFLGLANYSRKLVRNFSTIAAPMRRLLKKETIWQWDKDCTSVLKRLKRALIEYPVLKVVDPSLPFVVTTDASQYGIGAVLQQDNGNGYRPVEFMPARMPSEKVATSTYERELYALMQALEHWKHYLLGRHFKVYSDHETLRWLKTEAKMTPKLTRWAAEIDQYDFELKPVKGKYNVVADALSRRSDYFGVIVHYLDIGKDLQEKVRQAYAHDPIYNDLLKRVKEAPETEPDYRTTEGLLFEKTNVVELLCVPNSEEIRSLILGECHDTEGHFGWQKTLANLMHAYTWPGMKADCIDKMMAMDIGPVEFMSVRMPSEKIATSTYEKELYALRQALDHWKHYLLGRHLKVYLDHETLRWLKTQAKMTPKLTRWAAELDQYDFELKLVRGKYNVVADVLSRRADYFGAIVHYLDIGRDPQQKVREAYAQGPIYSGLLKRVRESPESEPDYRTTDGLLFEKTNVADRLCIPNSEEIRSLILGECHDIEGHFGWQKTLANLMRAYIWPGMKADCIEYLEDEAGAMVLQVLGQLQYVSWLQSNVSLQALPEAKRLHCTVEPRAQVVQQEMLATLIAGENQILTTLSAPQPHVRQPQYVVAPHPVAGPTVTPQPLGQPFSPQFGMPLSSGLVVGPQALDKRDKVVERTDGTRLGEGDVVFVGWSLGVSGGVLDGGGVSGVTREMLGQYGANGEVRGVSGDIKVASGVDDLEDRGRGDGLLEPRKERSWRRVLGGWYSTRAMTFEGSIRNVAEVFDARSGKRPFAELGVEFLLSEDREDLANMLEVGLEGGAKDEDIIKVHDDTDFEEVTKDVIHGGLGCGGGIGESGRHYEELIVPEPRAECCLMGVLLADTDLVEAITKVNLGEIFGSTKSVKELGDPSLVGGEDAVELEGTSEEVGEGHGGLVDKGGRQVFAANTLNAGDESEIVDDVKGDMLTKRADVLHKTLGMVEVIVEVDMSGFDWGGTIDDCVTAEVVVLGEGGGGATMVEIVVDEDGGVQVDGVGVEVEAEACPEEGVGWGVEGCVVVVTIVMGGVVPSSVVTRSDMDNTVAFMSSKEVWKVLSAWRMAERSEVAVFAGGCSPARLRAMLSTESVRMSDMLMEDATMSGEEGVEDAAGTDVEDAAAAVAAAAARWEFLVLRGGMWRFGGGGGTAEPRDH
ncbi:hypothetical protein CBR_g54895 [Chara braunii]|uniref:Reverse transcriptase domain-containing protein n=1 Tax=Chara braunii TaxID=69332 RepID=A0A388JPT8_CHABU|nr:hypothetical protein CBR_g54895 [Chara braunii]|eukprot:GBG59791.1 hypothetical protein CBR_g54895 [Chara braunii]